MHKNGGQVPWLVPTMTAWAFQTATMRTADVRGEYWGPVLRLPMEVQGAEEAQGVMEAWWGEEQEGKKTGVQMGWDCNNTQLGPDRGLFLHPCSHGH